MVNYIDINKQRKITDGREVSLTFTLSLMRTDTHRYIQNIRIRYICTYVTFLTVSSLCALSVSVVPCRYHAQIMLHNLTLCQSENISFKFS